MRRKAVQDSSTLILRMASVLVLLLAFTGAATAYTVVFRDGQRIEIPATFFLTQTTLTYEAAPGINRTVQLALIDFAATEKVNHESPGAFVRHGSTPAAALAAPANKHAVRTLTNRDLESARQRRIESEKSYEQRRIDLGLPSVEETRRRQAAEEESTLRRARERSAAEANSESYWRGRAADLRSEIAAADAQIYYLRAQLGQPRTLPFVTQRFAFGAGEFGRPWGGSTRQPGAGEMGAVAAPVPGHTNLTNMGATALQPSRSHGGFGRWNGSAFPQLPFVYLGNYYLGADMSAGLNDLLVRRAGLEARWRELENEARAARVPQVWLAPY